MLEKLLNARTIRMLERAMDGAALRQKVIANNIANVNTPDFKRSDVQFESILARNLPDGARMAATHPCHLPLASGEPGNVRPRLVADRTTSMRNDGNNVDIDAEMAKMVKNYLYFEAVTRQAAAFFERLRTAIRGGS